jgi:hypothetical protein
MYEGSYPMNFGASISRCIDAFVENLHGGEVSMRVMRVVRASQLLRAAP